MKKLAILLTPLAMMTLVNAETNAKEAAVQETKGVELVNCAIQQNIPGAKATGAFLTIKKQDDTPLSLSSAQLPSVTPHVEIHEMVMKDGTMKMSQIESYPLKKGDNIFQKGGYHIMLMEMEKPLTIGEKHQLTLTFSDGSSKSCEAEVKSVEALTPKKMKHDMKGMKHGDMKHDMKDMKHGDMKHDMKDMKHGDMKHDMKKDGDMKKNMSHDMKKAQ